MINAYLVNCGLCYFDIWEIQMAHDCFQDSITFAKKFPEYTQVGISDDYCCLALAKCLLGFTKDAEEIAKQVYTSYQNKPTTAWGRVYIPILLAKIYKIIGNIDFTKKMYKLGLSELKRSQYQQAKASILIGLAEVNRDLENLSIAYLYHNRSLVILKHIEAKFVLAEAYFQFGLTYQAMGEHDQAEEYKAKALELFAEMEAPKQIERVNKAFGLE